MKPTVRAASSTAAATARAATGSPDHQPERSTTGTSNVPSPAADPIATPPTVATARPDGSQPPGHPGYGTEKARASRLGGPSGTDLIQAAAAGGPERVSDDVAARPAAVLDEVAADG